MKIETRPITLDRLLEWIVAAITIIAALWVIPSKWQQFTDNQKELSDTLATTRYQVTQIKSDQDKLAKEVVSKDEFLRHDHHGRVKPEGP